MEKNRIKKIIDDIAFIPIVIGLIVAVLWLSNHLSSFVLGL